MSVTIKDIAERTGVSFSTVSKALRNSPLVQEKTKRKILEAAKQMGYVPNLAARKLVSNKSGSFGVIWPSVERVTPSVMITRINEILEDKGYTTLFSINRLDSAIEAFNRFQVDAILLFYDRDQTLQTHRKLSTQIPILYYGIAGTTPYPTIDTKRGKSIELAIQHLVQLGHTRIAYIGSLPNNDLLQQEKVDTFMEQMHARRLTGQVFQVSSMEFHDGYLAAKDIFQAGSRPSAIISGSYDLSKGILRAASESGLRVPDQLSLVSYDQIPQMDSLDIPVTAVGVDVLEIADQIAQSLIDLADGKEHPAAIQLEPQLVVRSSTCQVKIQ